MNEPLIYTTKGNLPIASLEYRTEWQDGPEAMVFVEEYRDAGEIVKRAVHVYAKKGLTGEAIVGGIN